jgi:hypothetical protein
LGLSAVGTGTNAPREVVRGAKDDEIEDKMETQVNRPIRRPRQRWVENITSFKFLKPKLTEIILMY